ncbi:MAG: hypothetical protein ACR2NR_09125 [Solirubrobacteraceae bacterium]
MTGSECELKTGLPPEQLATAVDLATLEFTNPPVSATSASLPPGAYVLALTTSAPISGSRETPATEDEALAHGSLLSAVVPAFSRLPDTRSACAPQVN